MGKKSKKKAIKLRWYQKKSAKLIPPGKHVVIFDEINILDKKDTVWIEIFATIGSGE